MKISKSPLTGTEYKIPDVQTCDLVPMRECDRYCPNYSRSRLVRRRNYELY